MQPVAVDMARVALSVLLALFLATCTLTSVSAQDDSKFEEEYYSGSGSASGIGGDPTLIDQEKEIPTEEEYLVKYVDEDFKICERYPSGKRIAQCNERGQ